MLSQNILSNDEIVKSAFAYHALGLSPAIQALAEHLILKADIDMALGEHKPDFVDFVKALNEEHVALEVYSAWLYRVRIEYMKLAKGDDGLFTQGLSGYQSRLLNEAIKAVAFPNFKNPAQLTLKTPSERLLLLPGKTPANLRLVDYRSVAHPKEVRADLEYLAQHYEVDPQTLGKIASRLELNFQNNKSLSPFQTASLLISRIRAEIKNGDPVLASEASELLEYQARLANSIMDILSSVAADHSMREQLKNYTSRIYALDLPLNIADYFDAKDDPEFFQSKINSWHATMRSLWLTFED